MRHRLPYLLFLLFFVFIVTGTFYWYTTQSTHEDIHIHAGFVVYVDGVKQDYTDIKYMNLTPCGDHESTKSPEEEQIEKAHLHDGVGDVVHVHRNGALWKDLFTNMLVSLDTSKEIVGYKEGKSIPNILTQPVEAYDSIVIVVGDQSKAQEYKSSTVTQDHIREVEQRSELCSTN